MDAMLPELERYRNSGLGNDENLECRLISGPGTRSRY
jgi:hypothetical protein